MRPNQSQTLTLDFASNQFRTASVVSPGAYFLRARVDSGETVPESNNKNNGAGKFISTAKTDVVLDWNSTLLNAIQAEGERLRDKPLALPITSPPFAARNAAIVHTAIYEALADVSGTNASRQAAVVGAAYQALVKLYPVQKAAFDKQRQRSLAEIKDGFLSRRAGLAKGENAADDIWAAQRNDGAVNADIPFPDGDDPGEWERTFTRGDTAGPESNRADALLPGWGDVTPFGIPSIRNVIPDGAKDGPPELGSARYVLEFKAAKFLGSRDRYAEPNTQRARNQAEIAYFWSYDRPDTFGPPGQWQEIAQEIALQRNNSLTENARLFAQLTTAMANASIAAWDLKYDLGANDSLGFNQWRPITAIREADTDPNRLTRKDPNWEPLLDTPPFPDYISGHAAFGGAAGRTLRDFYKTNNISFDIPSQDLPGLPGGRSYDTIREAEIENALSRVYGGVHVAEASIDGVRVGLAVGEAVANSASEIFPPLV